MRDPATHIDPKVEAAIEETCRFLEIKMGYDYWERDPDSSLSPDIWAAIREIAFSNLSYRTKNVAQQALFEQTKKRSKKPTRQFRDNALRVAADILVAQGYNPTRNEATDGWESASSIIHQALKRLGEKKLKEKQINTIVLKYPLTKPA
jgi:hypothetical protein